jgi:LacI family transcriptional regulator
MSEVRSVTERVTIRGVAARAGVSYQTVSRVISGSSLVRPQTREAVLQAMAALNYTPNAAARSLAGGRTTLLGVLVEDIHDPFSSAVLRGIEDIAYEAGYSILICSSGVSDASRASEYSRVLREQRAAGIIVVGTGMEEAKALSSAGITTVSIDYHMPGMDSVMLDNVTAAAGAVAHLAELGHRDIGIITGPLSTHSGRARLIGYRRGMRHAGLSLERSWQAIGPYNEHAGVALALEMLRPPHRPTALIAGSDDLTIGVVTAAASLRMQIPGDLALVGFDELVWTPALVSPITTVAQPGHTMGTEACRLLLERISGRYGGPARRLCLPARLMVRQSCGSPSSMRQQAPHLLHLSLAMC